MNIESEKSDIKTKDIAPLSETYLSWDIGIKHLAYCLIKKSSTKKYGFEILKWGIINLSNEEKICCEKTKQNKPCISKASYFKDTHFYCKKHKSSFVKKVCVMLSLKECDIDKKKDKNISTCVYSITKKEDVNICGKKASCIIDISSSYCTAHGKIMKNKIEKDNDLQKISKINANKIPLDKLAIKLYEELDKHTDFIQANEILIENQPSLTNPTMKSIMMLLYSYFIMNGLTNKKNNDSRIQLIKLIAPSNKIKMSSNAMTKIQTMKNDIKNDIKNDSKEISNLQTKQRQVYLMTKSFGVKFCLELVKDDIKNTILINSYKKKDDLCDAFLQGFHYIFCKKTVPIEVEQLLNLITDPKELFVDIDETDIVNNEVDDNKGNDNEVDEEVDEVDDVDEVEVDDIDDEIDLNDINLGSTNYTK